MAEKYIEMLPFFLYLDEAVKYRDIYLLGAQGEKLTSITIGKIVKNEDTRNNAARVLAHISNLLLDNEFDPNAAAAYDCSGLGSHWFQDTENIWTWDHRARDIFAECVEIPAAKRQPGDFVFKSFDSKGMAGHVGYLIKEDYVVEAKGRDDGVVKRKYSEGTWKKIGRPKFWLYTMDRVLSNGCKGNDVGQLQARLKHFGYDCGTVDNIFGSKTQTALTNFQKKKYKSAPELGVMDMGTAKKLGFVTA